jgi:hypothetical protein
MLAVVYEAFTRIEKDKFRKLLLHRRKACQHAFRLLVTRINPTNIIQAFRRSNTVLQTPGIKTGHIFDVQSIRR